jgi:uncharacterized protein (DUF2236 family)
MTTDRHVVTRPELEAALARLRGLVADPRAGIHGPGSQAWRWHREAIVFLGGGRAALLQLAHPFVAHAIDQHSKTRDDVLGRFRRTFENVFAMTFGDLDEAFTSARRVHNIHTRIVGAIAEDVGAFARGTRYHANDVQSLLWVHTTLMHSAMQVIELVIRPLSPAEKDAYYADTRRFAYLFGIPDSLLPSSWSAFDAYFHRMIASDEIAVGAPARDMARFLFQPPQPSHAPLSAWIERMTTGLLPAKLRAQYGLRYGLRERALFAASIAALRPAVRLLPGRLRHLPAYIDAQRKLEGRAPSRVSHAMERLMMYGVGGKKAVQG